MLIESKITYVVLDALKNFVALGRTNEIDALNLPPSVRFMVEQMSYQEIWEFAMQNPFAIQVQANAPLVQKLMSYCAEHPDASFEQLREFMRQHDTTEV